MNWLPNGGVEESAKNNIIILLTHPHTMSIEMPSYENKQTLPPKGEVPPEKLPEYLSNQFDQPDKFELYEGETLSLRDIQPEKVKTEVPLLILKGWGTTPDNYKANIIGLAEKGRRVLAVDNIHGINAEQIEGVKEARELVPDELLLNKVAATLKVFEVKEGLDQVDVVAHSEGAIHAIFAALLRPEKFRNLVLVDPAGMVGENNREQTIKGAALDIALQIARLYKREGALSTAKKMSSASMGLNKALVAGPKETWDSIGTITKTQIHELIGTLREQGIRVSIVHGVDDKFFSMDDVQKMTKSGTVDGFYSTKSTHNEIYLNPKPFNALIDSSLDSLEALRKKEEEKAPKVAVAAA
ncbi:MAG: alpha/beta hydrolase [bacterium]|nr:alpha/beta hydrolase [bacterium]